MDAVGGHKREQRDRPRTQRVRPHRLRQSTKRKGYKRSAVDFKRLLRSEQTAGFLGGGAFCRPKPRGSLGMVDIGTGLRQK